MSHLLASLGAEHSETACVLSVITVMELEYGWHRANTAAAAITRRRWLDAEMKQAGLVIATADLLIGAKALHHRYAIGARNVRHFRMIPELKVVSL